MNNPTNSDIKLAIAQAIVSDEPKMTLDKANAEILIIIQSLQRDTGIHIHAINLEAVKHSDSDVNKVTGIDIVQEPQR